MTDKTKHRIACSLIALTVLAFFKIFVDAPMYGWDKGIAAAAVVIAAAGKEIVWDKLLKRGTPEFYDFVAGLNAGWVTIFAWIIVETIFLYI